MFYGLPDRDKVLLPYKNLRDKKSFDNLKQVYSADELSAKHFIIILRDPIEREMSWFRHCFRKCKNIFDRNKHMISIQAKLRYRCNPNITKSDTIYSDSFHRYLYDGRFQSDDSMYMNQIELYLQVVPRSRLYIINLQTLLLNTTLTLNLLFDFLGIYLMNRQFDSIPIVESANNAITLSLKDRQYLSSLYKESNSKLNSFLNNTRTHYESYHLF